MTLFLAIALACIDPDPCSGVRDLTTSPAGIELTEDEHPGWGRDDCSQCHQAWKTHAHDCLATVEVDLEEVRERAVLTDPSTCVPCHGSNGLANPDTGP